MSQHIARKRFGQHFLIDQNILQAITSAIAPYPDDHMVEIGPGLGALTRWVLPYVNYLHVVEIDRDLAEKLKRGPLAPKLCVHEVDALQFDFSALKSLAASLASTSNVPLDAPPRALRVIGNLPYNISSPLLFHLAQFIHIIADQHFMLQKEVVNRMVATPGNKDFGRLTVMLQAYYHIESLFDVPPEAFDPPPRVQSSIVRMVPLPEHARTVQNPKIFSALVAAAFSQRRKMLRNTLNGVVTPEQADAVGMALTLRAEDVPVQQFINLANLISTAQNTK